jgi:hypothetical protein
MSYSVESNNEASCTIINGSAVDLKLDTTTKVEASIGTSNEYASVEVGASVKTGTEAEFKAGLISTDDGVNVVFEASYSDTTEAHITASASVGTEGVGIGGSVDAYVKSGTEASIVFSAGQNGVSAGAEASIGNCVGVDGEATVGLREVSGTVGGGVNIGEHFEAGGSGEATFKNGVATIGVSGDVAALIGAEVDLSVSIDTNQIVKDGKVITDTVVHTVVPEVVDTSTKVVNTVTSEATKKINEAGKVINDTGHKAKKEVDNIGKKIKKGLHF